LRHASIEPARAKGGTSTALETVRIIRDDALLAPLVRALIEAR
jgi:hypothetical protein